MSTANNGLLGFPGTGDVNLAARMHLSGLAAARPDAAWWNAACFYYATDTEALSLSDGSSWQAVTSGSSGINDGDTLTVGLTFPNTGLHILDTNASHDLIIAPGSNITADRTLTITTGDIDRTLTLSGNATISGTNTGDVTLAGSYDYITISGQVITRGQVDLSTDVTGTLPSSAIGGLTATRVLYGGGSGEIAQSANLSFDGSTLTVTGAITQSGGAFSLTGNAASSLTTSSGGLTITAAATSAWGTSAGSLNIHGSTAVTITSGSSGITLQSPAGQNISLSVVSTSAAGGTISITAGDVASGSNTGGPVHITGGAAASGTGGLVRIRGGDSSSGTDGAVTIGDSGTASVGIGASGITTTITGRLDQLTGALNLTANAASQITTSSGAMTITAAASSTWSTSAGNLIISAAAAFAAGSGTGSASFTSGAGQDTYLGPGTGSATGGVTRIYGGTSSGANNGGNVEIDGGGTSGGTQGAVLIAVTTGSAVSIGHSGITTTVTGGFTQQTGAFSLTGNAASSLHTSSGALTVTSAAALNLGTATTTSVAIGRSGITTTVTGAFTQQTGAYSLTGTSASTLTTSSGNLTIDADAALSVGATNADSVTIGSATSNQQNVAGGSWKFDHCIQRNAVINGNFDVWQLGTSFTGLTTGAAYVADRWAVDFSNGATVDVTRDTTVPTVSESGILSQYSVKIDVQVADGAVAAGDYFILRQNIEGYIWKNFAQRDCALSFWIRSSTTGTFTVAMRNGGADRSYLANFAISAANTWEKKTFVIPASPSAGTWYYDYRLGVDICICLMCGTTFQGTNETWNSANNVGTSTTTNGMASTSNNFWVSQVQLERGRQFNPFEIRPFGTEFSLCQRYLEIVGGESTTYPIIYAQLAAGQSLQASWEWKTTKRVAPTLTQVGTWATAGTFTLDSATTHGCRALITNGTGAVLVCYGYPNSTSNYLKVNAEF